VRKGKTDQAGVIYAVITGRKLAELLTFCCKY
jgi:hypothetical protein